VITNTNGEGYSSPDISLFSDRKSALDWYNQNIGECITGFDGIKVFTLFEDDQDGAGGRGCHLIEVQEKSMWIINGDFYNEIYEMKDTFYMEDALDGLGITYNKDAESEFWIEEDSHEACIAHAECQEVGTHYTIIQIKSNDKKI
jgi:hypothetical protein